MPQPAAQHVTPYEVKVDGVKIDDKLGSALIEVRVRQSVQQPSSAALRLTDPKGENVDGNTFEIGKRLEISLGAPEAKSPKKVFDGEIVALEPEFVKDGVVIGVRAYDKSHRLQRAKKVRTFQQMSASDMVGKIMREAGINGSSSSTSPVFEFFQQSDETDRDFIRRLERMHDYELAFDDDKYQFREAGKLGSPVAALEYGVNLMTFRPRMTAAQQDADVEVRGWDIKGKQTISAVATPNGEAAQIGAQRGPLATAFGSNRLLVSDRSVETTDEAQAIAKATAARRAAAFVEAEGTCFGNPDVKAGSTIELKKLGTKFSGKYVVTSVTHLMRSPDPLKTSFQISGRSDRGLLDLMHPPRERPWGQSLVIAVVTNNNDPEGIGRVRVKYPSLSDSDESEWARVLSHHLGTGPRGIYMLPQVNDEVVVAFENGDPRRPLVIGSLFNGKDKPTDEMLPDQNGGYAVLSDDRAYLRAKKDITFKSTEGAMQIEVKGEHQTKAQGDIKAESQGAVQMKSGQAYTLEAGQSMTIKGVSITVEAQSTLTLKGATVDIQGQAATNIKGGIINIG